MKKTFILVSLLGASFLASCGGGGKRPLPDTYKFSFEGSFCSINDDPNFEEDVIRDANKKYTILPNNGYDLPTTISVTDGISYQYDKDNGVINIDKMSKDVKVTATSELNDNYRSFTFTGTHCNISGLNPYHDAIIKDSEDVRYTISPDPGYALPTKLDQEDANITYDSTSGVIKITKMTSNVVLSATSEPAIIDYGVTFAGTNCSATDSDIGITDKPIFHIVSDNKTELSFVVSPDSNDYVLTKKSIDFEIDNVPSTAYSFVPEEGETGNYILTFTPSGETTISVLADIDKPLYSITFDSNEGSEVLPIENIIEGSKVNPPSNPTKEGYSFEGWYYDDETFEYRFDFETIAIYKDVELHAKWESTEITITLDAGFYGLCDINRERKYSFGVQPGVKWGDLTERFIGGFQDDLDFLYWTLNGTMISEDTVINNPIELEAFYMPTSTQYLTFTPRNDGALLKVDCDKDHLLLKYQKEGETDWHDIGSDVVNITVNRGTRIYFKGENESSVGASSSMFGSNNNSYFEVSGLLKALYKDSTVTLIDLGLNYFFKEFNNLKSAYNLSFDKLNPSSGLYCFVEFFRDCTSLTVAPKTLSKVGSQSYYYMFSGCTSLLTVPKLPATTLATSCYSSMFSGCTSLEVAPELPAAALADHCYFSMFSGCSSLMISENEGENLFFTCPNLSGISSPVADMFNETGNPLIGNPTVGNDYYFNLNGGE